MDISLKKMALNDLIKGEEAAKYNPNHNPAAQWIHYMNPILVEIVLESYNPSVVSTAETKLIRALNVLNEKNEYWSVELSLRYIQKYIKIMDYKEQELWPWH